MNEFWAQCWIIICLDLPGFTVSIIRVHFFRRYWQNALIFLPVINTSTLQSKTWFSVTFAFSATLWSSSSLMPVRESSTKPALIYIQYGKRASAKYSVMQITWVLPLLYRIFLLNMNAVRRISSSSRYEARCWCVGDKAFCRCEAWTHTQAQTKALFHKRCLCWKNRTEGERERERAAVL